MSDTLFQPATRSVVKPLIGLFGKSGGGKTLSALLMARGLVGPEGKVGLVDTENRRGAIFADMPEVGGYLHLDFQPPFHPLEYVKKIEAAERAGIQALVIDSMTHEWLGLGGYLDLKEEALQRMAGDDWRKREACAMAAAAQVKPKTHSKFVSAVLRANLALILCFRAHEKVKMEKEAGKTKIQFDENPSPMQDGDLIFEMLIAGECYARDGIGGYFRTNGPHCKHTHPSILQFLPKDGEQIGVKTGAALAAWCAGKPAATATTPTAKPADKPATDPRKAALATLWTAVSASIGAKTWADVDAWLASKNLATKKRAEMSAEEIIALLPKCEQALEVVP